MDEGKKRSIRNRRPPNYLFAEVVDLIGRVKTLSCTDMGEPIIPKSSFLYLGVHYPGPRTQLSC